LVIQNYIYMMKLAFILLLLINIPGRSQSPTPAYPSILWEISGNGLQKPSYLFGSMHISNKEVFHLSDSFYIALSACDVVALEVDPKEWQPDMFRVQEARRAQGTYSFGGDGYMSENDFRFPAYDDGLKAALREEPFVMNGLLYRTAVSQANFQEDTYLDLYIYQTGRRLGKKGSGVENYLQSERMSMEATRAAMREHHDRKVFPEGENVMTILNKLQDAYRRGDLSLLDSLNQLLEISKSYTEKFLYQRNDIQANSIDSIIRHQSLFVAVGAAHLPGKRGVIEALRKKGYTLRPVRMTDQDATDRERIDRLIVPVVSHSVTTDDGFIRCSLPGEWYRREESPLYSSWQYADMENGSYYLLTRVKTHSILSGQTAETVMKKIDSSLYDDIPGKIIQKQEITRNGYPGFDIVNKTRTGDVQRYLILVTPGEIVVLKMSGREEYVSGKEAEAFFTSVQLKEPIYQWTDYSPSSGGFRASFPASPQVSFAGLNGPGAYIWQYEAAMATGEDYLILKKNLSNTHFLEEDTLDLSLMEESLKGSAIVARELTRKFGKTDGHDCLDMDFALTTGGRLKARAIIRGPEYYLLLAAGKLAAGKKESAAGKEKEDFTRFFGSFHLAPFRYGGPMLYTDTSRHFAVRTPVFPDVPEALRELVEMNNFLLPAQQAPSYVSQTRTQRASFHSDSTGETIQVSVSTLPEYFYRKDSARFWENEMRWTRLKAEFILEKMEYFNSGDSICGYRYTLLDTNTNRKIVGLAEIKGNTIFKLSAVTDHLEQESPFIREFYDSFTPLVASNEYSMFASKSPLFFNRYHSKDSVERRISREALPHVLFEASDLPEFQKAIDRLKPEGKTYIESKRHLIRGVDRIRDTCCLEPVVAYLKGIYERSGDTAVFENAALMAMIRIRNKQADSIVKDWIIQKPPVFENETQLREMFEYIGEDTTLSLLLFPAIFQLIPVEGYKTPILQLMAGLADSSRLPAAAYESDFAALLADAQLLLKKQQMTDERTREEDEEGSNGIIQAPTLVGPPMISDIQPMRLNESDAQPRSRFGNIRLYNYAEWLVPFYDRPGVSRWFGQLLQLKSVPVKFETTMLLVRNNRPIPDTMLRSLAADDRYRVKLYEGLLKAGKKDLFPAEFKNQEAMARSLLFQLRLLGGKDPEVKLVGKQHVTMKRAIGWVYFYKYKVTGQEGWMMAISGVQPDKGSEVNTNKELVEWTRLPLNGASPEEQQFQKKLSQWVMSKRQSALTFYRPANMFSATNVRYE
jgi:uncharacterized protein YbaP (TraB family)